MKASVERTIRQLLENHNTDRTAEFDQAKVDRIQRWIKDHNGTVAVVKKHRSGVCIRVYEETERVELGNLIAAL